MLAAVFNRSVLFKCDEHKVKVYHYWCKLSLVTWRVKSMYFCIISAKLKLSLLQGDQKMWFIGSHNLYSIVLSFCIFSNLKWFKLSVTNQQWYLNWLSFLYLIPCIKRQTVHSDIFQNDFWNAALLVFYCILQDWRITVLSQHSLFCDDNKCTLIFSFSPWQSIL